MPVVSLLPTTVLLLSSLLLLVLPPLPLLISDNIEIISWDKNYKYEAIINNSSAVIYLDSEEVEDGVETDKSNHYPKAGKVKIVFKDSKQNGTSLIYERDMEDGAISEADRIYIEKVLTTIEQFHKENHTFNGKVKDTINSFFKSIKKKK